MYKKNGDVGLVKIVQQPEHKPDIKTIRENRQKAFFPHEAPQLEPASKKATRSRASINSRANQTALNDLYADQYAPKKDESAYLKRSDSFHTTLKTKVQYRPLTSEVPFTPPSAETLLEPQVFDSPITSPQYKYTSRKDGVIPQGCRGITRGEDGQVLSPKVSSTARSLRGAKTANDGSSTARLYQNAELRIMKQLEHVEQISDRNPRGMSKTGASNARMLYELGQPVDHAAYGVVDLSQATTGKMFASTQPLPRLVHSTIATQMEEQAQSAARRAHPPESLSEMKNAGVDISHKTRGIASPDFVPPIVASTLIQSVLGPARGLSRASGAGNAASHSNHNTIRRT